MLRSGYSVAYLQHGRTPLESAAAGRTSRKPRSVALLDETLVSFQHIVQKIKIMYVVFM